MNPTTSGASTQNSPRVPLGVRIGQWFSSFGQQGPKLRLPLKLDDPINAIFTRTQGIYRPEGKPFPIALVRHDKEFSRALDIRALTLLLEDFQTIFEDQITSPLNIKDTLSSAEIIFRKLQNRAQKATEGDDSDDEYSEEAVVSQVSRQDIRGTGGLFGWINYHLHTEAYPIATARVQKQYCLDKPASEIKGTEVSKKLETLVQDIKRPCHRNKMSYTAYQLKSFELTRTFLAFKKIERTEKFMKLYKVVLDLSGSNPTEPKVPKLIIKMYDESLGNELKEKVKDLPVEVIIKPPSNVAGDIILSRISPEKETF